MPYLYFFFLLIFLLSFALFLSFQLYKLFTFELFVKNKRLIFAENIEMNQLFYFIKYLLYKKRWFQSLKLLESQIDIPLKSRPEYFNVVGFIYYKMHQFYLAELYYKVSLSYKVDYEIALKNLSRIEQTKS
jgi:hypothetical protein